MRKKFITFLLAFSLTSSMLLTACGNKETDSGGGKTETETEAPADDQQAESEKSDEVTTEEEDAVEETDDSEKTDVSETPDVILTADTEITDEDMQEIYASIKESVEKRYLEPNSISPADFSWPDASSTIWGDYSDRSLMMAGYDYSTMKDFLTEEDLIENLERYDGEYSQPDKQILDSVLLGIFDWMQSKGDYDEGYFSSVFSKLLPMKDVIPTNVTFN